MCTSVSVIYCSIKTTRTPELSGFKPRLSLSHTSVRGPGRPPGSLSSGPHILQAHSPHSSARERQTRRHRSTLCLHPTGRSKSHGPGLALQGGVVFHLEKSGVGKLRCQQGRETSVANFCPLPHLSLIKPFGFTNVVSPGFEIHPVAVSKLRSSVPIQALLQRKI